MAGLFNPAQLRTMGNPQTMDDNLAQYALAQRLRESQAMRDEADAPIDNGMAGGQVVPIQWTQMLSKVLKGYGANKLEADALQQSQDYATAKRQRMAAALQGLDLSSTDAMLKAAPGLLGNSDTQGIGNELLVNALRQRAVDAAAARQDAQFNQRMSQSDKQFEQRMNMQREQQAAQMQLMHEKLAQAQGMGPANVQEWKFFNSLAPADQARYLTMKRANQAIDLGGEKVIPNPAAPAGDPLARMPVQLKPGELPETKREQAAAAATGKNQAAAASDLPSVLATAEQGLSTIKQLQEHPGLQYITGAYAMAPIMPGTKQAGADALASQIEGQTFLQAYQTLKGGGQITEVEGKKAEAAIGRLKRSQSTDDYKKALGELSGVISAGVERAKAKAGAAAPASGLSADEQAELEALRKQYPKAGQ